MFQSVNINIAMLSKGATGTAECIPDTRVPPLVRSLLGLEFTVEKRKSRGYSMKFRQGRLCPEAQTLSLIY